MIFKNIFQEIEISSSGDRREMLISQMLNNEKDGKDCLGCTGRCCTFEANSMQMTSIEAIEALVILEEKNLINEDLIKKLNDCIDEFRLDKLLQIGPGEYFRKTYTCPFFNSYGFGCALGKEHKPYGCIAFNPCEKGITDGGNCQSDLDIQEKRNEVFEKEELEADKYLFEKYGIDLLKKPIPVKLLEVLSTVKIDLISS